MKSGDILGQVRKIISRHLPSGAEKTAQSPVGISGALIKFQLVEARLMVTRAAVDAGVCLREICYLVPHYGKLIFRAKSVAHNEVKL
jgi:hypothetical protein